MMRSKIYDYHYVAIYCHWKDRVERIVDVLAWYGNGRDFSDE